MVGNRRQRSTHADRQPITMGGGSIGAPLLGILQNELQENKLELQQHSTLAGKKRLQLCEKLLNIEQESSGNFLKVT